MKDGHFLYYDRPAGYWQEALPLGNGSLGAMVFGGVFEEKISLNHDTLWSGRPGLENGFPGTNDYSAPRAEIYRKARELSLAGKNAEAEKLLEEKFEGEDSEAYLPLGDLLLDFGERQDFSDYRRTLDLSRAVAETGFRANGKERIRRAFVSHPDGVLVLTIRSEEAETFRLSFSSPLKSETGCREGVLLLTGEAPSYYDRRHEERAHRYLPEEENRGMRFAAALSVRSDGETAVTQDAVSVKNAKNSVILLAAGTSFRGFDRHPHLEGKDPVPDLLETLKKAERIPAEELLARHEADHRAFYDRVDLDLGSDGKEELPTDERLKAFLKDKNDRGLYTLIFNFGRYLMIAGSRAGSEPLNLQGIWNDQPIPPWNANYTTNINTEMNYWPALPTGLFEMTEPLTRMIRELRVTGRRTAEQYYGAPGFTVHHNSDLWRHSVPVQGQAQWSFWPMGSGWLCRHLYEYYAYTGDKEFLKNEAYPAMREAAEFYLALLTDDGKGRLILAPSTSPENGYRKDGKRITVSETTAMTAEILADLFRNLLASEKALGISELTPKLQKVLEKLWMPGIGSRGQLNEWYSEEEDDEPHHRHVSHLYGLYPAALFTEDTPSYLEACKRSLEERGDDGTGWSLGWKINLWARLSDGDHALKLLDTQLRYKAPEGTGYNMVNGGGTYPNLFDAHPPFQIDGNFACVSGIAEMLLRSGEDKIVLLPALPARWKDGSVRGLRAKGGLIFSFAWREGKLTGLRIEGKTGEMPPVFYQGRELDPASVS